MSDTAVSTPPAVPGLSGSLSARPFLPALVVLFVGSGCAALIYEIVWLQMLGLVIGGSAISLGVLLGTFMGGMCLGSLLLPRFLSRKAHPLLVYGILELAIGIIGIAELWLVPTMGDLYTHFASPGGYAIALRAFMAAICLLPPTILMGATLPAIARYVESSPRGVSWLGFFYGGNTLGAVGGCLLASWYLLRYFDMSTVVFCAAAINAAIALLAILLSLAAKYQPSDDVSAGKSQASPGAWAVYVCLALSGLTGLGSEVIWTRQLSLMLGATVYTFANILAVFLLGLGIGSSIGSFIARSVKQPKATLGWCQFLLAGAIAWAAYAISNSIPFWPIDLSLSTKPWFTFQVNLAQCFWAVFPGALLWGASFPIGLAALARRGQDPGKMVGGLYAANTVGAICGSLLFSMVVMQYCGSQNAQRILVALCVLSGIIALAPLFAQAMAAGAARVRDAAAQELPNPAVLILGMLVALVGGGVLIVTIDQPNWGAVAWGRNSPTQIPRLFPGILHKEIPLSSEEQLALKDAEPFDFKQLDIAPTGIAFTLRNEDPANKDRRAKAETWVAAHEKILLSALGKKAVAADEYAAVIEANQLGLQSLQLVDGTLIAGRMSPPQEAWLKQKKNDVLAALRNRYKASVDKPLPALLTALENAVLLESSQRFKKCDIVNGKLAYELADNASKEQATQWLQDNERNLLATLAKLDQFALGDSLLQEANRRGLPCLRLVQDSLATWELSDRQLDCIRQRQNDLIAAMKHRAQAAGTASILPYDEKSSPNRYCVYLGEGMNVSVAVTYDDAGFRYFHGAGKVQASSNPEDMRLQRNLGHISALTNFAQTGKKPEDVLVVACGAGVTAGSFVPYNANITIVDIEPMVPRYVTPQFADVNHDVIPPDWSHRPTGYKKTNIVIDDGRHFIRTYKGKYDVITSDPIDPWVKGCAALNTVEYYQMCKDHLKPGGIMALWIPFYESSEETSKSVIATFFKVFKNGILWSNDQSGSGYDAVLFGSVDMNGSSDTPLKLNVDKIQEYLERPENQAIRQSIRDVHFGDRGTPGSCEAVELLATYAGTAPRMLDWTKGTDNLINYDRNLRLQYIAGMYINNLDEVVIFNHILQNYSWPDEIFTGTPEHLSALRQILEETGRHDRTPRVGGLNLPG